MTHAAITGVGSYLPEEVLTNADLERLVDTSNEWIRTRTGIAERRVAARGEASSDLAARAGTAAMADAGIAPTDIDLLVLATSSPDHLFPSTASLAQSKMGLDCPAYDVMAACTGFVFAVADAAAAIESGRYETVLVVGTDAMTRLVDFTDRGTCVLFGDGASAFVMQASDEPGVLGVDLGTDGTGADMLSVPACGSAAPADEERIAAREQFVQMRGNEVFKFAVRVIPETIERALAASDLDVTDVAWIVPHQANQRIITTIPERLGIPDDRVVSIIEHTGNTSTASIPLAVDHLYTSGELSPGDMVVLVGFGAGVTWGTAVVRWTKEAR
jgi:3-oxoacyl-[acyl-carrier-protein] synthase-3